MAGYGVDVARYPPVAAGAAAQLGGSAHEIDLNEMCWHSLQRLHACLGRYLDELGLDDSLEESETGHRLNVARRLQECRWPRDGKSVPAVSQSGVLDVIIQHGLSG